MRKTKIAIIGHFGGNEKFLDGQTIKTKIFYEELKKIESLTLRKVDTYYKRKNIFKLGFDFCMGVVSCKHIIILVAENGMRTFFPVLYFVSKVFNKKIYHAVIGASLANRVVVYKNFKKYLNSFCVNWCETIGLVRKLRELGVTNAELLYNCKRLTPILESELANVSNKPYRLCMFSRVMKEKGVEDAIYAVKSINDTYRETIYSLDIYGQIDLEQQEWFENIEKTFPSYIKYGGMVQYEKSVEILKDYFALLFPTQYWTEGVPGTIIDAYAAGLPVIASKWENFDNIIDENTGIGYEFGHVEDLVRILDCVQRDPSNMIEKKAHCLKKYKQFSPDAIMDKVLQKIEC